MCIRDSFLPYLKPVKIVAQELPVKMVKELLDNVSPPPGLEPSDIRPGTQNLKEDPYGDIEVDFFKPSAGSKRTLQRRTPPPPPPLPETSSLSSIPEESFSLSETPSSSSGRWVSPMQLFAMPPSDTSRSMTSTPSVPKSWATDITSPFASFNERLELQGQGCDATSTSKHDRWGIRGNVFAR
eukprot:12428933-Alexandrium_andersonii.AAC.1